MASYGVELEFVCSPPHCSDSLIAVGTFLVHFQDMPGFEMQGALIRSVTDSLKNNIKAGVSLSFSVGVLKEVHVLRAAIAPVASWPAPCLAGA